MRIINGRKVSPGQIYFDKNGEISQGFPATYVLFGCDKTGNGGRLEWRAACFRNYGKDWRGASTVLLWDEDVAKLKLISKITMRHLRF